MGERATYADLVGRLLGAQAVRSVKPPREVPWPLPYPEPPDLAALYARCDGLTLTSGVVVFGRGELHDVTQWLVLEKGLSWPADLVVIGERRDTAVVLDLDVNGERAGGGVVEVANDDFGVFERVASGVLPYLLLHAAAGEDPAQPPEVTAPLAAAARDAAWLARELSRPMYPGAERLLASLANTLGVLLAEQGEIAQCLVAFERSVAARLIQARRGAREAERRSAWRAAAFACRARGLASVAALCDARADGEEPRASD